MLRRLKRELDEVEFGKISNVMKKIEAYEYVSFDIFDTLIKRDVHKPTDVFFLMEKTTKIKDFADARIKAEQKARVSLGKMDVTLEDIYSCFDIDVDREAIMKLEREYECNLCTANTRILPIYKWCVEKKKKIIIISDMYLDYQTIATILRQNDFNIYEKIFISNKEQKTKQCGNLYPYVLESLNIEVKQIVHIGNSFVADYYRAVRNNWKAIKVKTSYSNMSYDYNKTLKKTEIRDLRCLESFINNHTVAENPYFQFGFENFGPALVGFSKWLLDSMLSQNREIALFLGRDGYIMKQVYEMLGFHKIIPTEYIEVSRRCFRILDFVEKKSYEEIHKVLPLRRISSVAEYIACLGLELESCMPAIREFGLDEKKSYMAWELGQDETIEKLYYSLQDKILDNAKEEKEGLLQYINAYSFDKRVGLVDVGWGGTIQHYLEILLKEQREETDILGYYWGVADRAKKLLGVEEGPKARGYFYDCLSQGDKFDYQRPFDGLIETFFLQQIGSVKNYSLSKEGVIVNREPYEYANEPEIAEIVKCIQDGAIAFVDLFKESVLLEALDFDKDVMFANLYRVCTNPSKEELKLFKNIYFYDSGNMKKLFEDYNIFYAFTHPKKLKNGYYEAYWRIGYLKNIFRLDLPYMKICLEWLPYLKKLKHRG